jgi:CHAT domain-containing protein
MTKFLLSLLLAGLLVFCFSQEFSVNDTGRLRNAWVAAENIFRSAEKMSLQSDDESTQDYADKLYGQALVAFRHLLPGVRKAGYDSLAFFIHLRLGFIHYYFDSLPAAKNDYLSAIAIGQRLPLLADSFLFKPFLFTGSICYSQNQFDSALVFYKKAGQIADHYNQPLAESQRLYNRLGVMFYETGNYRQAKNYFEKALSVLSLTGKGNESFRANYMINIASLLVKLEEYQQAKAIYQSIPPGSGFRNEILHNLGIINGRLGDYQSAVDNLRKVNYGQSTKNIDLFYNFGMAFSAMQEPDSALFYFQKAIAENTRWNGSAKNTPYGLVLQYLGNELARDRHYKEAIDKYQQAILQFDAGFHSTDIYSNPASYSGSFSFINLFHTLVAKADVFEKWYEASRDSKLLEAALNSYRSAYQLADYVEKTYDSDEARLFLNRIKYLVHSKPITVSLNLFDLTQEKKYLEDAYFFDQRNKASILSLNVRENEWKKELNASNPLLQQESALRTAITRLSLKAAQAPDSSALQQVNAAIRDQEIELGKIQEKINADPAWQQKRAAERIPSVEELQQKLDAVTALLSFHLSDHELLILLITGKEISYHRQPIGQAFFNQVDSLKELLSAPPGKQHYDESVAMALYRQLIAPVRDKLARADRLIIIPDDELNYLPFEALQDENKKYLTEQYAIQYQYSTALLGHGIVSLKQPTTLAVAPFASAGYTDQSGQKVNSLPATREETARLPGKLLLDTAATKNNFLAAVTRYPILHLATHATVNNEDPSRSFIAFYPAQGDSDTRLYAQEIYDLDLDSVQLVILSACETGTGKLVKGEGLMSLSRAFAYAGCPNIIASLWKAEDKTTAFIIRRLHDNLDKGYTKDKALQQARIDLLHSPDIDPRFKSPNYWAHLLYIGQYEPVNHSRHYGWWLIAGIVLAASIILLLYRKRNRFAE